MAGVIIGGIAQVFFVMFGQMFGGPCIPAGYNPNLPKDIKWKDTTKGKDFPLGLKSDESPQSPEKKQRTMRREIEDIDTEFVKDTHAILRKIQTRPADKEYTLIDDVFPAQAAIFKKLVDNTIVRVEFINTEGPSYSDGIRTLDLLVKIKSLNDDKKSVIIKFYYHLKPGFNRGEYFCFMDYTLDTQGRESRNDPYKVLEVIHEEPDAFGFPPKLADEHGLNGHDFCRFFFHHGKLVGIKKHLLGGEGAEYGPNDISDTAMIQFFFAVCGIDCFKGESFRNKFAFQGDWLQHHVRQAAFIADDDDEDYEDQDPLLGIKMAMEDIKKEGDE